MARVIPITEQFQHFVSEIKESFWGDLYGKTKLAWKGLLEEASREARDRYLCVDAYARAGEREYRNGFYERSFVTIFGTLVLRIARTRTGSFLPRGLQRFQRRAEEVMLLIREAFLRGVSTRQVGRGVATVTGEPVSAQTVSPLSRHRGRLVKKFQPAPLEDAWAYLFLDGVSLRVRRPSGRKRVQMLVAYGVKHDGSRQLLAFMRSSGESEAAWEGFLNGRYKRGRTGKCLLLIVTDGCPGLAAARQTVYPRVKHPRCWVHKMRNILEKVRKRDYHPVKAAAQAIYGAEDRREARQAFQKFRTRWQGLYASMVKQLEKNLPELLTFFDFPKDLRRKLRTTNVIERCFVEVRRRTRPMVCFVNVASVDRIIYAIFHGLNQNPEWKNRTLRLFTQAA